MFWANISMVLPFAFQGLQNGLGSWFRANNVNDSTNGHSWCGYPYQDSSPVFAPDILLMGNGSSPVYPNPNWAITAKQYCGLEAKVYNPVTGQTILMYLGDAFDHKWVHSPGSIDIMINSYSVLYGSYAVNKDLVIMDVQWEFTGNYNPRYKFGGVGDPW